MLVPMPLVMRGVPAQIFFAVPEKARIGWNPTLRRKKVGLTLDHPLQVELELDLLAGVDDEGELEEDGEEEAQPCQRPKRPHQNLTLNPTNALQQASKLESQRKFYTHHESSASRESGQDTAVATSQSISHHTSSQRLSWSWSSLLTLSDPIMISHDNLTRGFNSQRVPDSTHHWLLMFLKRSSLIKKRLAIQ